MPHGGGGEPNETEPLDRTQLGRRCALQPHEAGTVVHQKKTLHPDLNTITTISVMGQMTFLEWKTPHLTDLGYFSSFPSQSKRNEA